MHCRKDGEGHGGRRGLGLRSLRRRQAFDVTRTHSLTSNLCDSNLESFAVPRRVNSPDAKRQCAIGAFQAACKGEGAAGGPGSRPRPAGGGCPAMSGRGGRSPTMSGCWRVPGRGCTGPRTRGDSARSDHARSIMPGRCCCRVPRNWGLWVPVEAAMSAGGRGRAGRVGAVVKLGTV